MARFRPAGSPPKDDGLDWFWTDDNPMGCGWGLCPDNQAKRQHSHPRPGSRPHPPYVPDAQPPLKETR